MNILSRRETIDRIESLGFTEAAAAMRRREIPCPLNAWHTYFQSRGDVFRDLDGRYFIAPDQLTTRPSEEISR